MRAVGSFFATIVAVMMAFAIPAQSAERTYLYKVSTLRADLGELTNLIEDLKALEEDGFYRKASEAAPLVMRHTQGDQWDLMLLKPIGSYEAYYARSRMKSAKRAKNEFAERMAALEARLAFREDLFAYGPAPEHLAEMNEGSGFYHIEMFHAAPGLKQKLVRQREMENDYLVGTGRRANLVFVGDQGSDVDVFTIGFYRDLQHFAEPAPVSAEEREEAAKAAGFEGTATIGTYLRTLMSSHHDTLAVSVP